MAVTPFRRSTFDLLRAPALGRFLRWRHARTTLQAVLLSLAALVIYDGLFGPPLAPKNIAGVLPWVHWRGLVVLALLVAGNLFCLACPFMLPRRLAKWLLPAARAWPAALRSKWLAAGLLIGYFWAYEAFDLWASPWLTAWLVLGYFAAAFVIDGYFKGAAFCKYVCPIGQFHFVNALISPLEVKVRDPAACTTCTTKDCIGGRYAAPAIAQPIQPEKVAAGVDAFAGARAALPTSEHETVGPAPARRAGRLVQNGCELWLFQPRKAGNLDCTFCLDCVQACPHENVGVLARPPLAEFTRDPHRSSLGRLAERPDLAALTLVLVFGALINAFGMVPPVYELERWLAAGIGTQSEPLVLAIVFVAGLIGLPLVAATGAAWASRALTGTPDSLVTIATRYSYGLVPLGFAFWLAHYLFHFLTGALTVVPLAQSFLADFGLPLLGEPDWRIGEVVPVAWLTRLELLILQAGVLVTILALWRIARSRHQQPAVARQAIVPWIVVALLLFAASAWVMTLPMEMRGTILTG